LFSFVLAALAASPACAADAHLDVGVATQLPTDLGVKLSGELPSRVRLGLTAGFMPPPYLDLINGIATGFGWYGEPTAQLIDAALNNALIVRLDAGIRPIPKAGFTADAGYMLAFLGGGLAPADAVSSAVADGGDAESLQVHATLHLLTVTLGYDWVIADRVVLGPTLGGAFTLASSSSAEIGGSSGGRFGGGSATDGVLERATEELLDQTFKSYVHTPTVGLRLSYRFF
jgi:hypothetical protein